MLHQCQCHKRQILWKHSKFKEAEETGQPNAIPVVNLDPVGAGKNATKDILGPPTNRTAMINCMC